MIPFLDLQQIRDILYTKNLNAEKPMNRLIGLFISVVLFWMQEKKSDKERIQHCITAHNRVRPNLEIQLDSSLWLIKTIKENWKKSEHSKECHFN